MSFMLPRTGLIAFIDESGDFEMNKIDPQYPICSQCAVTCDVEQYLESIVPNMMKVKYSFFGNECVVMHGHKIRKKSAPFHILQDEEIFSEFMDAITWCFSEMKGTLIIAAVDKPKHKGQYIDPFHPFYLTLQFLLERLHLHWQSQLSVNRRLLCVFEMRGKEEDKRTQAWFDQICQGDNFTKSRFHFDADFRPKNENVIGHQYADLASFTACRYAENRDESRKDWQAIKGKLANKEGEVLGFGLKIFPA